MQSHTTTAAAILAAAALAAAGAQAHPAPAAAAGKLGAGGSNNHAHVHRRSSTLPAFYQPSATLETSMLAASAVGSYSTSELADMAMSMLSDSMNMSASTDMVMAS
ncbi:hypothetical protein HK405_012706, partial [Cladochytrium tenue]